MKKQNDNNLMEEGVNEIIQNAMMELRNVIDSNTIVGKPVILPENITVLPISRVNAGFVAGGGEIKCELKKRNNSSYPFTGGSGSGFVIEPVGFITINKGEINYINVDAKTAYKEVLDLTKKVIQKIIDDKEENNDENTL